MPNAKLGYDTGGGNPFEADQPQDAGGGDPWVEDYLTVSAVGRLLGSGGGDPEDKSLTVLLWYTPPFELGVSAPSTGVFQVGAEGGYLLKVRISGAVELDPDAVYRLDVFDGLGLYPQDGLGLYSAVAGQGANIYPRGEELRCTSPPLEPGNYHLRLTWPNGEVTEFIDVIEVYPLPSCPEMDRGRAALPYPVYNTDWRPVAEGAVGAGGLKSA